MNGLDLTYMTLKNTQKNTLLMLIIVYYLLNLIFLYFCSPSILARGVTPSLLAAVAVISTRAQAPSFSVLALAAVTVPT